MTIRQKAEKRQWENIILALASAYMYNVSGRGEKKMSQMYFILVVLAALVMLGFFMSRSIKKHDAKMANVKKKKGRSKYMPEYKKPGK